jgi:hypothetical protein
LVNNFTSSVKIIENPSYEEIADQILSIDAASEEVLQKWREVVEKAGCVEWMVYSNKHEILLENDNRKTQVYCDVAKAIRKIHRRIDQL